MNNIEIKQITKIDDDTLATITKWMHNWWGREDWYTFEEVKCFMKHSLQKHKLPQTYGVFVDNKIYTKHHGLYEKFGWKYVSDFDTYRKIPRIQGLYKLDLLLR